MIDDRGDGGLSGMLESLIYESNNNEHNNGIIEEKKSELDQQKFDTKEETDDPYFIFQDSHQNDESLDLINGIATISSNNPSIRSYQMIEEQRPGLTENSNQGIVKMSMTEVTTDKTKKQ